jgi:hypothetical protein
MQLTTVAPGSSLRRRLGTAACLLLASGVSAAHADGGATTQLDATALIYGEKGRTNVVEPTARVTRLFANGQSLSAQLGIDVITGASPSGATPSGRIPAGTTTGRGAGDDRVQTVTAASGGSASGGGADPGAMPTARFQDARAALDLGWTLPLGGWSTSTLGGHFSREKDYQSVGGTGQVSIDMMHKLTTLTLGGGYNHDDVFPTGGLRYGLSDGTARLPSGVAAKEFANGMVGVSRILTRGWMVGFNASRTVERGYLTDPYKIVSVLSADSGLAQSSLTERRPSRRQRTDVLGSTVYHFHDDVLHLSYRYYWDDWRVRSHTLDLKVRHELDSQTWIEPHVRFYAQTAASFYRFGLVQGAPLPDWVSADYRLGPVRSVTVGGTVGFHLPDRPGEWSVRAEYIGQFGDGHPRNAPGIQRTFDLFPTVNIGTLVVSYSLAF